MTMTPDMPAHPPTPGFVSPPTRAPWVFTCGFALATSLVLFLSAFANTIQFGPGTDAEYETWIASPLLPVTALSTAINLLAVIAIVTRRAWVTRRRAIVTGIAVITTAALIITGEHQSRQRSHLDSALLTAVTAITAPANTRVITPAQVTRSKLPYFVDGPRVPSAQTIWATSTPCDTVQTVIARDTTWTPDPINCYYTKHAGNVRLTIEGDKRTDTVTITAGPNMYR